MLGKGSPGNSKLILGITKIMTRMLNNIAALYKFRCMMTKEIFCSLVVEIGFTVVFVLIVLIYFPTFTSLNFIFFLFYGLFSSHGTFDDG